MPWHTSRALLPQIEHRCRRHLPEILTFPARRRATASAMLEPTTESRLDTPSGTRLVIRVKLIPQEPPQPPARRRLSRSALLILGAVALPLSWLGISTLFRPDATSPPAATEKASAAATRTEDSLSVSDEPLAKPAIGTTAARSVESPVPDASPAAINQVIPDVPRRALETIRGTVKVSVRVTLDKRGTVVHAAADDRGPSRYFERLAVEAAKKWTFVPADSDEQRTMLVRFDFTRAGATAHATPLQ